jgi:ADP-ribose pyrophosphatase
LTVGDGWGGVVVVGRRPEDNCVALVRHYHPVVSETFWEFPRGISQDSDFQGVSPVNGYLRAAKREFAEETGWTLDNPEYLGSFLPDSGILNTAVQVIAGTVGQHLGATDGEADRVMFVPLPELIDWLWTDGVWDGMSLAALTLYQQHRGDGHNQA